MNSENFYGFFETGHHNSGDTEAYHFRCMQLFVLRVVPWFSILIISTKFYTIQYRLKFI